MDIQLIAAIVALVVVAIVVYNKFKPSKNKDIDIPEPEVKRTDLLYGYFGTYNHQGTPGDDTDPPVKQIDETRDHVNLVWAWDFLSAEDAATVFLDKPDAFGVLDLASYLWTKRPQNKREDAEQAVRDCFKVLRDKGALSSVKMLVPIDEPNLSANWNTTKHLPWAAELMRRVAKEFHELDGVLLGCIYIGGKEMPHLNLWDVVGFDIYQKRSGIFEKDSYYDKFKKDLLPTQRTLLLPGGYSDTNQDPTPFINFAHANKEVMMVVPFLWCSVPWEKFKGIRDSHLRESYVKAGKSLIGQ